MIVLAAALSIVTPVATHVTCLGMEASQVLISCCLTVYCSIAFLFRESGNSKSIWNNIFFPVALPSNFGTWNVYPVISKNLPWLFYPGKRFLLSFSIWNMSNSDQGGTKSTLPEKRFYFLPNKFCFFKHRRAFSQLCDCGGIQGCHSDH